MKKIIFSLTAVMLLSVAGCAKGSGGGGTPKIESFTVTWKNDDGTVLKVDTDVPKGTVPEYVGDEPTKESAAQFSYTFTGWIPIPEAIESDMTYTASYLSETRTYTVRWLDHNGRVLETDENVPYGATPTYDSPEPYRSEEQQYEYTFSGWTVDGETVLPESGLPTVAGDMDITAHYSKTEKKHYFIFYDWDYSMLQGSNDILHDFDTDPNSVYEGSTPTLNDSTVNGVFSHFEEVDKHPTSTVRHFVARYNATTKTEALDFELFDDRFYILKGFKEGYDSQYLGIPATYNGKPVQEIGTKAFQNKSLIFVYIPYTIKALDNYCFDNNRDLKSVVFEEDDEPLTYWGSGIFRGYSKLPSEFIIPARAKNARFDTYAFNEMHTVKSFRFENDVSDGKAFCKDGVFYTDNGQTLHTYPLLKNDSKFTVPATVRYLNNYVAFYGNNFIEEVTFLSEEFLGISSYTLSCGLLDKITFQPNVSLTLGWYPIKTQYLETLILPAKTKCNGVSFGGIGTNSEHRCNVYFEGTNIDAWAMTSAGNGEWYKNKGAYCNVYVYSESAPTEAALNQTAGYWHYVNNVPTMW